jgi:hypothetical protein
MNNLVRDINGLDRVVHEPARLMIVTILSVVAAADFVYLLHETELNKGSPAIWRAWRRPATSRLRRPFAVRCRGRCCG